MKRLVLLWVLLLSFAVPFAFAAAGDPLPGVDVALDKKTGGITMKVPLQADGTFSLKGLAPGTYVLRVKGKKGYVTGQAGDAVTLAVNQASMSAGPAAMRAAPKPITSAQLSSGFAMEVQVAADGTLSGRLQAVPTPRLGTASMVPTGQYDMNPALRSGGIPGVEVVLKKKPGGKSTTVKVQPDGTFSTSGLEPGTYTLGLNWTKKGTDDAFDLTVNPPTGARAAPPRPRTITAAEMRRGFTMDVVVGADGKFSGSLGKPKTSFYR